MTGQGGTGEARPRARDLGIRIGRLAPGRWNAITDVPGVRVGHATIVRGEGPLIVGRGPVRTGVTVIVPHDGNVFLEPVFAGWHSLNGNGELTGTAWLDEVGLLSGPVAITNTNSVGVVHDAIIDFAVRSHPPGTSFWSLPVVGETWDGALNDINGFHVTGEHLAEALASAVPGPVVEGSVGGGTGMICHEFKGGIGTASRVLPVDDGGWTVGVLVQANYGVREDLRVDGVPVGAAIPVSDVPSPFRDRPHATPGAAGAGSIIIVVATDAPLLPHQCRRLAQRAGLGLARAGGYGRNSSGDMFVAFATGNRGLPDMSDVDRGGASTLAVRMVADDRVNGLFQGAVDAAEEAIVNALLAAGTMSGANGTTAHGLEAERVTRIMEAHGHAAPPTAGRAEAGGDEG
jgi:D-aminopeptidase